MSAMGGGGGVTVCAVCWKAHTHKHKHDYIHEPMSDPELCKRGRGTDVLGNESRDSMVLALAPVSPPAPARRDGRIPKDKRK